VGFHAHPLPVGRLCGRQAGVRWVRRTKLLTTKDTRSRVRHLGRRSQIEEERKTNNKTNNVRFEMVERTKR
jgi:hypothetical protein